MSLKELTAEKHKLAESTLFMKSVFDRKLPHNLWVDWTFQKTLFYGAIEGAASNLGILDDLPEIKRSFYLYLDFAEMWGNKYPRPSYRASVVEYSNYLESISHDPNKIMAHLYTWHLGDMYGGQMIKKIVPGSHRNLDFENAHALANTIRSKLNDSMADEANVAFDWAIRIMKEYDPSLE